VNAANNTLLHEYSYDAWGRMRNTANWNNYSPGSEPVLFVAGRGFTGHEHLPWFNLINMNGRLYDPLTAQFLSPDDYVQDPTFTQNYNRYIYCLNNPLKYVDPSGYKQLKSWEEFWEVINNLMDYGGSWNSETGYSDGSQGGGGGGYGVPSGSGFQGPGQPYMLGEVTITAQVPEKNTPTTPIIDNNNDPFRFDKNDPSGGGDGDPNYWLGKAGAIAVTTSAADGPIPIGEAIGVTALTIAATHDATIAARRYLNKQGVQYTLRTATGDIWKIGQTTQYDFTTNTQWRYSQSQLNVWGVTFLPEFSGNRMEILMVEKMKLWNYIHIYNALPPGNKVPW